MRLLVSVRTPTEANRALAGGAEIIDAKEPAHGALGAVSATTLRAIRAAVPPQVALSAALGDVATGADVLGRLAAVTVPLAFVKLGFRGVPDPRRVETLIEAAVGRAKRLPGRPAVIAVAYADFRRAGSPAPESFVTVLPRYGAGGLLVDTCFKDGGGLFAALSVDQLAALGSALNAEALTFAVAGSLGQEQVRAARDVGAAIFGVRGAVCRGGRGGEVEEDLVRRLAEAVGSEPTLAPV